MKLQRALAGTSTVIGALLIVAGSIFAGALCAPVGDTDSLGLHRWTPPDGEQLLVYSRGLTHYMTSIRVVITAAFTLALIGGSFIVLSRRLLRTQLQA